ncbi:MAG: acyl-CoA synthetase [Alphaproteobacteria bacterium]|nr:acyl-CoA synthetase [Alphaproteobacteria bacterium]
MLEKAASYEEAVRAFRWRVPEFFNIGVDVSDKHAGTDKLALIYREEAGTERRFTFRDIARLSNRLANVLQAQGLKRGDRLGILLPQSPETAIAHVAAYKAGLVAVPLFALFGAEALEYRLSNCGARGLVTDAVGLSKIAAIRDRLPDLRTILITDGGVGGEANLCFAQGDQPLGFWPAVEAASDRFDAERTRADDPALIIYTSGTTGQPKGALHAHRVLLGHLPGVEFPHEFLPQPGDLMWTPADWAWIGGLLDVLLPAWHHGIPVLAYRARKFDPEEAFFLLAKYGVRNAFLPPTALKLMRGVTDPRARHAYALRSIGSGGETLGSELLDWGHATFGLTINEFYGQTECNLVVGNCAGIMPARPGLMGRAIPGHTVAIVDDAGNELPDGEPGNVAVKRPDPVMFLEYWRNPEATRAKFAGDWLLTGDTARREADGYFRFQGRADDVITSAGYRIGPAEIEDCLLKHPAVAMAAVIGVPDPVRTEAVKAFIVPKPGIAADARLVSEVQAWVRTRLAAHEYPRLVEFVDTLPMTTTGKIQRKVLREREAAKLAKEAM